MVNAGNSMQYTLGLNHITSDDHAHLNEYQYELSKVKYCFQFHVMMLKICELSLIIFLPWIIQNQ